MRTLATEGRTVLVASHLIAEMEHTADHRLVIGRGQFIADCGMVEFIARGSGQAVRVRTPQPDALARAVAVAGGIVAGGAGGPGQAVTTACSKSAASPRTKCPTSPSPTASGCTTSPRPECRSSAHSWN